MTGARSPLPKKASDLIRIFVRKDEDGAFVYDDKEIREFLPLLLAALLQASNAGRIPGQTEAILGRYYAGLGISPGASDEEVRAKMAAHYAQKPINARLLSDFRAFLRDHATDLESPEQAEAFLAFAGGAKSKPLDSGERPEGTIPAGPMAAFRTQRSADTNDD